MQLDFTSKTTWACIAAVIGGIGSAVGVHIDPLQMSTLVTDLTATGQAITIIAPIFAAVWHLIAKKKAQTAIVNLGASDEAAKAATKS